MSQPPPFRSDPPDSPAFPPESPALQPDPWRQGSAPSQAGYGSPPEAPPAYDEGSYQHPYPPQQSDALMPYGPAGSPLPVPAWAVAKPSPMPSEPREYPQMLRGGRYRWWKALLTLALAGAFALIATVLATVALGVVGLVQGQANPMAWVIDQIGATTDLGPIGFIYVNLSLIVLIPSSMFALWIVHRVRPKFLTSVVGGLRWRWMLRCLVIVAPIWAIYLGATVLLGPEPTPRPAQWPALLVIVVVMTPFQAAGEEYFFRGLITQTVGSWFAKPLVAFIVPTVVGTVAFALAHGSTDPWIFGSLAVFALTAAFATWRTGGLEAGIAIHSVNNIGVFFVVLIAGGWQEAFVSGESKGTPLDVLIALVVHGVALALILWQAKKERIQRTYAPVAG